MKSPLSAEFKMRTLSNIAVIAAGVGIITLVWRFKSITSVLSTILGILFPFLLGCVLAFILTPIVTKVERFLQHRVFNKSHPKIARSAGIIVAYGVLILAMGSFIYLLVPQLIQSLRSVTSYVAYYWNTHANEINDIIAKLASFSGQESNDLVTTIQKLISEGVSQLLSMSNILISNVVSISVSISNFLVQIFVALCAGIYLLIEKEHFAAQSKKILCAFMPTQIVRLLVKWARKSHAIFAGFINGKIVDSVIIGILCYIAMMVLKLDYALLISVVVGITNILPFFGPFIGAIPSVLILLLISPWQALEFAILILVLQQIDGNIIGPRVLGDTLGLSPFWIMLSIIVGSGLFGFVGILLGVPVFALIYAIVQATVEYRLEKRGLPTDTKEYRKDDIINGKYDQVKEN